MLFFWVATQTGLFKVKVKVKVVGVGPHRLGGGLSPPPPRPPGSFTARYRSRLCFRKHGDSRKIPPLRGALPSGYNPRKKTRGFPPLVRRDFGTGLRLLLHNLTFFEYLKPMGFEFEIVRAIQKSC